MIILTDLADWGLEPLDWPVEAPPVKHRLSKSERRSLAVLDALMGEATVERRREAAPDTSFWGALAVVDCAHESQYDILLAAARSDEKLSGPVAALALEGKGFHGNRGRRWRASRGNLHLSCLIPAELPAARCAVGVPALPVVAVGDALERCAPGLPWRIKWVNDLTVRDAKLAGVISAAQSRGPRLTALVYGIGVNVAVAPPIEPTLFVPRTTCLHRHEAGRGVGLGQLCRALLETLGHRYAQLRDEGPAPLVSAYRARCGDVGRRVRVWAEGLPDTADAGVLPAPLASGRVLALDDDLALHVEGSVGALVGGRLAHLEPEEPAG